MILDLGVLQHRKISYKFLPKDRKIIVGEKKDKSYYYVSIFNKHLLDTLIKI